MASLRSIPKFGHSRLPATNNDTAPLFSIFWKEQFLVPVHVALVGFDWSVSHPCFSVKARRLGTLGNRRKAQRATVGEGRSAACKRQKKCGNDFSSTTPTIDKICMGGKTLRTHPKSKSLLSKCILQIQCTLSASETLFGNMPWPYDVTRWDHGQIFLTPQTLPASMESITSGRPVARGEAKLVKEKRKSGNNNSLPAVFF